MRPVTFEYHRAESLEQAIDLLAELGDEAHPLAGGYSLIPMMNLRLARPTHLVDINSLNLDTIEQTGDVLRIGGLVRHVQLLSDPLIATHLPLFVEAAHHIAHPTIRNRGSLGGSLAHADPTAELGLLAVLHDGVIVTASKAGGRRIPAGEFFKGAFTTALEPGELVVALEVPVPTDGYAGAFLEFAERRGDFAIVAVGARIRAENGKIANARLVCAGATSAPVRGAEAEEMLKGRSLDDPDEGDVGKAFAAAHEPPTDIRATSAYRRDLIAALTSRTITTACERAGGLS